MSMRYPYAASTKGEVEWLTAYDLSSVCVNESKYGNDQS